MATKLDISELDFDAVKANLKTFLSDQTEFSDYDFEGSGMSVLLDVLAYNTHYLGYNANMLANEMFLDSADLRSSVVSLAKAVGYTPTSAKASSANINVVVNNATGASLTMTRGTKFTTTVNSQSYSFVNNADVSIAPVDGVYTFSSLPIYEGSLLTFKYTVDTTDIEQRFIIPNNNVDTTTLTVKVQNSSSDSTTNTYTLATGITELDDTSKVYFLQEIENLKFEVYFGDGVLGKAVEDGNIVILDYIVTNRSAANGASTFALSGNIGGFSDVTITTNGNAAGGTGPESISSIKYNAPRDYSAQDRAVTADDYKTRVKTLYANADAVQVWGGEDHSTPNYGKVYISIKAKSGANLTVATKDSIVTDLKRYAVASVTPTIIDPETTYLTLVSNFKYNSSITTKDVTTLQTNVLSTISTYSTDSLQNFTGMFRHSALVKNIDATDTSILSNVTTVKLYKYFAPTLNSALKYTISYNNAFYNPHSDHNKSAGGIVSSTGFKINDDSSANEHFLDDDGSGIIRAYYLVSGVRTYTDSTYGTINYTTGEIILTAAHLTSISNIDGATSTVVRVFVIPNSNDIVPVRNQILQIDTANSTVTGEVDTIASGSSQAGTSYTTSSSYSS
ncbi:hypothetical protein HX837_04480 [Marine Group I thaumarchaeote]|uniref:Baseplate wedge subunit n=1 Tax=Marine Group I thaumarchaeote TaxID=2511932 RepID=A0A7K4MQ37_9ARCH|nr:hypothetical protein [Marine Group I thaumarchaeote]